jgi:hypothetical protein
MDSAKKRISTGLGFAAGTLFGAVAVFVPLSSAGHVGSPAAGSGRPTREAVRSSGPVAAPNAVTRDSASSETGRSFEPKAATNQAHCDVQLD